MIIEIVDAETKIDQFLPHLHDIFEQANCGGLVTIEKVQILRYFHAK